MKKTVTIPTICASLLLALSGCGTTGSLDMNRLAQGGSKMAQSLTITNSQIQEYVKSYIAQTDAQNSVCGANDSYTKRLNNIVSGITSVENTSLNFKVYRTSDINAFACADGSIRVYSGLMDAMTDDEVLGVIGHEIGHVAHEDTKNAFKNALQTAAFMDILSSTSTTVATLTDSQLGTIAQSLASAKFSKSQENNADDYGYSFLKQHGKNPAAMVKAFRKLQQMEQSSGQQTSTGLSQLFSTHPDISSRIKRMEAKCKADGYAY